jgi:hypothetical protein
MRGNILSVIGALLASAMLLLPCHVFAGQKVEGIAFEDAATVNGQRLKLNGVGVGQQLSEKIHVSALYLTEPQTDASRILTSKEARRLEVVLLRRVSERMSERFFLTTMKKSTYGKELLQHTEDLGRFGEIFAKAGDRNAGDRIQIDWVPSVGIEVRINGKRLQPTVNNEVVYRVLLDGYIGVRSGRALREGLLRSTNAPDSKQ